LSEDVSRQGKAGRDDTRLQAVWWDNECSVSWAAGWWKLGRLWSGSDSGTVAAQTPEGDRWVEEDNQAAEHQTVDRKRLFAM